MRGHTGSIMTICVSADGKALASGGEDKKLKIWGLESGEELGTMSGHANSIKAIRFSRDSKQIASAGDDKSIRIWYSRAVIPKSF